MCLYVRRYTYAYRIHVHAFNINLPRPMPLQSVSLVGTMLKSPTMSVWAKFLILQSCSLMEP